MCMIIAKPAKCRITEEDFIYSWYKNPDMGGIAYVEDGKVKVKKPFHDVNAMWKFYQKHMELPMMLHFRLSTSGFSVKNCHPFIVDNGSKAFCHNGVLDVYTTHGKSDTYQLYEVIKHYEIEQIIPLLEIIAGTYNKFCFLDKSGRFDIINADLGIIKRGVWFSNEMKA